MAQWPLKWLYYGQTTDKSLATVNKAGLILCMFRLCASLSSHRLSLFILFSTIVEQILNNFGKSSLGTLVEVVWQFWCKFLVIQSKKFSILSNFFRVFRQVLW